jgi:hypothetical protein
MGVSITADTFPLDRRVFNAFNDVRDRFIINHDLNARHFVDISWAQPAIGNSTLRQRCDSGSVSAHQDMSDKQGYTKCGRNLYNVLDTQATRLVQSGQDDRVPAFRTIEVSTSRSSTPCASALVRRSSSPQALSVRHNYSCNPA